MPEAAPEVGPQHPPPAALVPRQVRSRPEAKKLHNGTGFRLSPSWRGEPASPEPIAPTGPTGVPVFLIWVGGNVLRPLA